MTAQKTGDKRMLDPETSKRRQDRISRFTAMLEGWCRFMDRQNARQPQRKEVSHAVDH
jgi:hypothetical protein